MLGVARWPKTEAVVVLAGEDQPFHNAARRGLNDMVGVKIAEIEDRLRLIAVAPLAVGKRVDGEMQETVELELVPGQLTGSGERGEGSRRIDTSDRRPQPRERGARAHGRTNEPA